MVIETEVNFEKKGKGNVAFTFYIDKSNPGDELKIYLNGEILGTYSESGQVTMDPGDKIELEPKAGPGSYFSFYEGINPPKVLTNDETVRVHFRETGDNQ